MNFTLKPTTRDKKILKYAVIAILTITVISYWFGDSNKPTNTKNPNPINGERFDEAQDTDVPEEEISDDDMDIEDEVKEEKPELKPRVVESTYKSKPKSKPKGDMTECPNCQKQIPSFWKKHFECGWGT